MPPELQVRLLRVLETATLTRVGGSEPIRTDVRVLAATSLRAEEAVAAGKLREDLFYRLNVFPITLPPLREQGGGRRAAGRAVPERAERGFRDRQALHARVPGEAPPARLARKLAPPHPGHSRSV
jgi:transcriptional regulator with GAF, ATPase, and Fis domain